MMATIVEFVATLTTSDILRLRDAHGLKLDRYLPDSGYLERLSPAAIATVSADFLVRSCTAMDPARKLSPSIADLPGAPGAGLEFSATLFEEADFTAVEARLAAAGASDIRITDDREAGGLAAAHFQLADSAAATTVAGIDEVVWIEPVFPIAVDNVGAAETIQSGTVGKSPIWDQGLHGEGQIIGVIDEGPLPINHCFFVGLPNAPGPLHRKVVAIFNDAGSAPGAHAAKVSSILAGDDMGHPGTHVHRGGAWNARLVSSNKDDVGTKGLLGMLNRARDAGAMIHTNSWQEVGTSLYDKRARDVDAFSWANEDHLVIAAGSNTGGVNSPPGTAKNTLCVAAAKASPDEMQRGSGVDGPTADGRRKPEITAVGCGLGAATPGTACGTSVIAGCHTSYATPHVAAAAALVRQYFTEGFYPTGKRQSANAITPSGALLKAVLLNATVDMTGEPGYPSRAEGWGLLRLNRSLFFAGGPRRLAVKDVRRSVGLDVGDSLNATDYRRTYSVFVNDRTEELKITLVWTDPPPTEQAFINPTLNSIKLTAEPDEGLGETYLGNDIDTASGFSRPEGDGGLDVLNNVHMIIVKNPQMGPWTITVSTKSIWVREKPYRQGYALVASGGLDLLGFLTPK
jgi:hypothetical protein